MTVFDAVSRIEDQDEEHDQEELLEAWQYLIDTGAVWRLQGWYGRAAMALIESGEVSYVGQ
jgi:hypothetical protein